MSDPCDLRRELDSEKKMVEEEDCVVDAVGGDEVPTSASAVTPKTWCHNPYTKPEFVSMKDEEVCRAIPLMWRNCPLGTFPRQGSYGAVWVPNLFAPQSVKLPPASPPPSSRQSSHHSNKPSRMVPKGTHNKVDAVTAFTQECRHYRKPGGCPFRNCTFAHSKNTRSVADNRKDGLTTPDAVFRYGILTDNCRLSVRAVRDKGAFVAGRT